jgi:hypothetical protein
MARPTIAAYLRIDGPEDGRAYPQVGEDSSLASFQAVYWRTASVFYASSRRANPEARHLLFTNGEPPTVDGHDLTAFFQRLDVELVDVPYTYCPPEGYFGLWRNQFYVLDVIRYLSEQPSNFPAVILDLDCVFVDSGDRLFEAVRRSGVVNYIHKEIEADPSYACSGLTVVELQQVAEEIAGGPLPRVRYCGGGIFGATWEVAEAVNAAAPSLWQACLERHARGLSKLNTEEHFFSHLYTTLGLPVGTADGLMRVIWTQRYRTVTESDLDLTVWHLPAEKKYGFRRLFAEVTNPASPFWHLPFDPSFTRYLGSRLGVPRATVRKRFLDGLVAVRGRLRKRFLHGLVAVRGRLP